MEWRKMKAKSTAVDNQDRTVALFLLGGLSLIVAILSGFSRRGLVVVFAPVVRLVVCCALSCFTWGSRCQPSILLQ